MRIGQYARTDVVGQQRLSGAVLGGRGVRSYPISIYGDPLHILCQRRNALHRGRCCASHRYRPVMLRGFFFTWAGVPDATISPPAAPPPGPMSTRKSALRITSRSCSITTTVAPLSSRVWNTPSSVRTSSGWRPMVGSSKTKTVSSWPRPISLASFRRCASPPERLWVSSPRVR